MDAQEIGEIEARISVELEIDEPTKLLREYRYRFNQKRRELIRGALGDLIDATDTNLRLLSKVLEVDEKPGRTVEHEQFDSLKQNIAQVEALLGSSVPKPPRWDDLHRHMYFGMIGDLHDIIEHDWPSVKSGLRKSMSCRRRADGAGLGLLVILIRLSDFHAISWSMTICRSEWPIRQVRHRGPPEENQDAEAVWRDSLDLLWQCFGIPRCNAFDR